MPLQGILEVIKHFNGYKDIPQISQLSSEVPVESTCMETSLAQFKKRILYF